MKKLLIILLLVFSISLSAQDIGIEFNHENWTETLAQAKAQNKMIFVDAYTTWCGPCKWMSKNIFPLEHIGSFYNSNFINLKLDMEKGEGLAFAQAYKISGYPSFLFFDAQGDIVHRSMGSRDESGFLELGEAASDPDRQIMKLQEKYAAGERSPAFLKSYVDGLTSAGMDGYEDVTKAYMSNQKDWNTPDNIQFLFDYSEASMESELFQYMINNRIKFNEVVGQEKVDQKLDYASKMSLRSKSIEITDTKALTTHFEEFFPGSGYDKAMQYYIGRIMYTTDKADQEVYLTEVQLYLANNPETTWNFLNSNAWQVYEISDDKDLLLKAKEWAQRSIEIQSNSFNTDTMAAILFKLKDKEGALKYAEISIKKAKEEGADATATKELLSKIMAL